MGVEQNKATILIVENAYALMGLSSSIIQETVDVLNCCSACLGADDCWTMYCSQEDKLVVWLTTVVSFNHQSRLYKKKEQVVSTMENGLLLENSTLLIHGTPQWIVAVIAIHSSFLKCCIVANCLGKKLGNLSYHGWEVHWCEVKIFVQFCYKSATRKWALREKGKVLCRTIQNYCAGNVGCFPGHSQ